MCGYMRNKRRSIRVCATPPMETPGSGGCVLGHLACGLRGASAAFDNNVEPFMETLCTQRGCSARACVTPKLHGLESSDTVKAS